MQARQQKLRAVVKSVTLVSSDNVEKEQQKLIDEDSLGVVGNPTRTKEDDWSDLLISEGMAGVLSRKAHPLELGKDLEWQKWLVRDKADWEVSEVRSFHSMDLEVEPVGILEGSEKTE